MDAKRSIAEGGAGEVIAIYLRRKEIDIHSVFEDMRDRTTLSFSIRLCGAPGSATSNSICGRSVSGKSFGTSVENSWGWESFVNCELLSPPVDSKFRFVCALDML